MKRSKKTLRVFALLFGIIGILVTLIFGIIGFRYFLVYNNREISYARIMEINHKEGYTVVRYTTNEQSYNRKLRMIDSSWYESGYITVIYDKNNPNKSFIKNQAITALSLTIVGIVFSIIGFIAYMMLRSYNKRKNYLLKKGKKIDAKIEKVSINNAIHFKGKNPYQIELSYTENGKEYTFIHKELWFDVNKVIEDNNLKTIEVCVDKKDYNNYYINLGKYGKNTDKNKNVKKRK